MGIRGTQGRRKRVHDFVIPFGLLFFAAFVYFSVWGWLSIGPAQAFRTGQCAPSAPITASCRSEGTATVTGTLAHYAQPSTHGGNVYGVTYTGHGRIQNGSVTYSWGTTGKTVPIPKKGQEISVTTWQGRPVYLAFDKISVMVSTPPDKDTGLVAVLMDVAALGAVCAALVGRRPPHSRRALAALRVVDWVWLPGLIAGYLLVVFDLYLVGFATIDAAGGLAFVVSQAVRVRLAFIEGRDGLSVGDHPHSPPPPGARAERERRREPGCPVSPGDQRWIEFELTALWARYVIDAGRHPIVLPHQAYYPVSYDGRSLELDELTRKLCGATGVDFESVLVRLVGESAARAAAAQAGGAAYSGHFGDDTHDPETGLYVIDLDRSLAAEPPVLTAVIAHELAHVRLLGARDPGASRQSLEQRADLFTIAMGLGLFGANVSFRTGGHLVGDPSLSLGRLDRQMYGYALACHAWLRGERDPQWAKALGPIPRGYLDRGLNYLEHAAGDRSLPTVVEARSR